MGVRHHYAMILKKKPHTTIKIRRENSDPFWVEKVPFQTCLEDKNAFGLVRHVIGRKIMATTL